MDLLQDELWEQYVHVSGQPPVLMLSSVHRCTCTGGWSEASLQGQDKLQRQLCTMDGSLCCLCMLAALKTRSSRGVW